MFCVYLLSLWVLTVSGATVPSIGVKSDYSGTIRTWVVQYDPEIADDSILAYRDLLRGMRPSSRMLVVVHDSQRSAFLLSIGASNDDPRIEFLPIERAFTCWARDRYIIFDRAGRATLLLPRTAEVQSDRIDDLSVGEELARHDLRLDVVHSRFDLEGGNVILDDQRVFIGADAIEDNLAQFDGDVVALRAEFLRVFGRELVAVGDPEIGLAHEHIDMFMTIVGPGQILLGDPRLALPLFDHRRLLGIDSEDVRGVGSFTEKSQQEFLPIYAALVTQLSALGYKVTRIPILHGEDGEVITWNNAVIESDGSQKVAYVPSYGVPLLDDRAHAVWRTLGYRVVTIQSDAIIASGGAIRCLTNVLSREQRAASPAGAPPHSVLNELSHSASGPKGR